MTRWFPYHRSNRYAAAWPLRLYRLFLSLYPSSYRSDFAEEMSVVFAQAFSDARAEGWQSVVLLCWRELRDLPSSLSREYWLSARAWFAWQLNEGNSMVSDIPGIVPVGQGSLPHVLYVITGRNRWLRRSFDITLALIGLTIVFPLLFILPLLIKVDSSGPVLYRQTRLGRSGQPYVMYKFRSMYTPQPMATHHVTRVGRWTRRWHWDEIPQLFNVLRGDMSIFGPRPPLSK